jgi:hypothetical protein
MQLSDRALLVQLNISQWTARKYDKKATQEVADAHGVKASVGRYNKSLLPANDYLAMVHQKAGYIRNKFYENTLAWGIEGTQLLPTANYLNFVSEFRKEKAEWETLKNLFVANYPTLKADAKRFLTTLYREADYPHESQIAAKFRMDIAVFPVPTNDFRVQLGSEELSRIQRDVEERVQNASASAMRDVWQRLYGKVEHLLDKMVKVDDPKSRFHESSIEHVKGLCELLPRLNFADDPNLEAMRHEVEQKLASLNKDVIVGNDTIRATKIDETKDIMERMKAFMGGM